VTVVPGLGWPEESTKPGAESLGWPEIQRYPQNPQVDPQQVQDPADGDVSRETRTAPSSDAIPRGPEETSHPVSRETDADAPDPIGKETSVNHHDDHVGANPQGQQPTSRPLAYRTAGDIAAEATSYVHDSTPMAQSVEHELLLKERIRLREPLPRPPRTRVMVVANQKGGVGKTTSTVNLAAALAQHGSRVLVVDLDPQGNASTALSIDHHRGTPSTYDALVDGVPFSDIVQKTEIENLSIIPATIDLAGAEIDLVSLVARESRLRKAIHAYDPVFGEGEDRLDYVLIDCPPSLGLLTLNALVAGDEMLIPIQAEYYALEGLGQLLETVEMVRSHLNPELTVSTILLTMYDSRTRLAHGVADEVRSHFGEQVLRTSIPRSVRVSEAPSYGQTVMTYDPASPGALSYMEAARELALRGVEA
jgi:chromosome partitioning protein